MTMTAVRNECHRCGATALPGMAVDCDCDDTLTLFTMEPGPTRIIGNPYAKRETPEEFRARIDAHAAEAAAFFDGFELNPTTESETLI